MLATEKMQIVPVIMPVNLATGANSGDYVSLKNYKRATFIFLGAIGVAGQDPTLTFKQATSVAAAGEKALETIERVDIKQATALSSVGVFTKVEQAAADTYTNGTAGELQKLWVVDVKAEDLDAANGYDCVTVNIADTGSTAQLGCVIALLSEPRYAQETLPSAIVD